MCVLQVAFRLCRGWFEILLPAQQHFKLYRKSICIVYVQGFSVVVYAIHVPLTEVDLAFHLKLLSIFVLAQVGVKQLTKLYQRALPVTHTYTHTHTHTPTPTNS